MTYEPNDSAVLDSMSSAEIIHRCAEMSGIEYRSQGDGEHRYFECKGDNRFPDTWIQYHPFFKDDQAFQLIEKLGLIILGNSVTCYGALPYSPAMVSDPDLKKAICKCVALTHYRINRERHDSTPG